MKEIKVDIGNYKTGQDSLLIAFGLGSCVGVFLYDSAHKIGALGHVLLSGSCKDKSIIKQRKYCFNLIDMMLGDLINEGSVKEHLIAKIGGGAHMFQIFSTCERQPIGYKNVQSVKLKLQQEQIPLISEDVGGEYGRTLIANTNTGMLVVKTVIHGTKEI